MKGNAIRTQAGRMMALVIAVVGLGVAPASAKVRTVEDLRSELAAIMQDFHDLSARLHRVAGEMRPLEDHVDLLLEELEQATDRRTYNAILDELREVSGEWSALRYEQVNMAQELEYLADNIAELEAAIARAEEKPGRPAKRRGIVTARRAEEKSSIPESSDLMTVNASTGKR